MSALKIDNSSIDLLFSENCTANIRNQLQTDLHIAVEQGDSDAVRRLIHEGAGLYHVSENEDLVLHTAAFNGHVSVVELLLKNGAHASHSGNRFGTVVEAATSGGHYNVLKLLAKSVEVRRQGDLLISGPGCSYPAHISANLLDFTASNFEETRDFVETEYLAEFLTEPSFRPPSEWYLNKMSRENNALLISVEDGNDDCLDLLLQEQKKFGIRLWHYGEALWKSIHISATATIEKLFKKSPVTRENVLFAALLMASALGNESVARLTVQKLRRIRTKFDLIKSRSNNHEENGAVVVAKSSSYAKLDHIALIPVEYRGFTALELACRSGSARIMDVLIGEMDLCSDVLEDVMAAACQESGSTVYLHIKKSRMMTWSPSDTNLLIQAACKHGNLEVLLDTCQDAEQQPGARERAFWVSCLYGRGSWAKKLYQLWCTNILNSSILRKAILVSAALAGRFPSNLETVHSLLSLAIGTECTDIFLSEIIRALFSDFSWNPRFYTEHKKGKQEREKLVKQGMEKLIKQVPECFDQILLPILDERYKENHCRFFRSPKEEDIEAINNLVCKLLDLGASISGKIGSQSPLVSSVQFGYTELTRILLERGANPNDISEEGLPALVIAAKRDSNPEIVALLLKYGAEPDLIDHMTIENGWYNVPRKERKMATRLWASLRCEPIYEPLPIVEYLMAKLREPIHNHGSLIPMAHRRVFHGTYQHAKNLLLHGCQIGNNKLESARVLEFACLMNDTDLVANLLGRGLINQNASSAEEVTIQRPSHAAALRKNVETMKLLFTKNLEQSMSISEDELKDIIECGAVSLFKRLADARCLPGSNTKVMLSAMLKGNAELINTLAASGGLIPKTIDVSEIPEDDQLSKMLVEGLVRSGDILPTEVASESLLAPISSFIWLSWKGCVEALKCVLRTLGDIEPTSKQMRLAITLAAQGGHTETVAYLLTLSQIDEKSMKDWTSNALHHLIRTKSKEMSEEPYQSLLDFLLQSHACIDFDCPDYTKAFKRLWTRTPFTPFPAYFNDKKDWAQPNRQLFEKLVKITLAKNSSNGKVRSQCMQVIGEAFCERNESHRLDALLKCGVRPTPRMIAISAWLGYDELTQKLLALDCDLSNVSLGHCCTLLNQVAELGASHTMSLLLKMGLSIDHVDCHGTVVQAALNGCAALTTRNGPGTQRFPSIEFGRSVKRCHVSGVDSEMMRSEESYVEIVKIILRSKQFEEASPAVKGLLVNGPSQDVIQQYSGGFPDFISSPPLATAFYMNSDELVDLLLEKGGNPHVVQGRYHSALCSAAVIGRVDRVQKVIQLGINVQEQTQDGRALVEATKKQQHTIVELLLGLGANPNRQYAIEESPHTRPLDRDWPDLAHVTPLHIACWQNDATMLRILLAGSKFDADDEGNAACLAFAITRNVLPQRYEAGNETQMQTVNLLIDAHVGRASERNDAKALHTLFAEDPGGSQTTRAKLRVLQRLVANGYMYSQEDLNVVAFQIVRELDARGMRCMVSYQETMRELVHGAGLKWKRRCGRWSRK